MSYQSSAPGFQSPAAFPFTPMDFTGAEGLDQNTVIPPVQGNISALTAPGRISPSSFGYKPLWATGDTSIAQNNPGPPVYAFTHYDDFFDIFM